jgi:hypothetical protein
MFWVSSDTVHIVDVPRRYVVTQSTTCKGNLGSKGLIPNIYVYIRFEGIVQGGSLPGAGYADEVRSLLPPGVLHRTPGTQP